MLKEGSPSHLPPHAFPLGSLSLEQTKVFLSLKGTKYPTILAGFRDPGPSNAQIPVLSKLKEDANICVVCDSRGEENFRAANLGFHQLRDTGNILLCVSELAGDTDAIFTSKSDHSGVELTIMANALQNEPQSSVLRPQIVELEDYPGCIARWHYDYLNIPRWIQPDFICATSEWGKKKELESLPSNFNPNNIIVTGQPNNDRLAFENIEGTKTTVKQKLQLGSGPIIVHMGTLPSSDTVNTLRPLVEILQKPGFEDATLIFRPHPRDIDGLPEYKALYEPLKERALLGTNDRMVPILEMSQGQISDALAMTATVLINHGSTTGVDAVYRGIPTINTFIYDPPKSQEEILEGYPLPVVEDKASPLATTPAELSTILDQLLHDSTYQNQLRMRMNRWKVDGHATKRVAEVILTLAKERHTHRLIK
ncbi:MAG: hypothetical protein PHQ59_05520 [Candidatus Daviesbacteria bacterium]|nr:hypothetical protein [Candidatus Daviesbacteria bacterium]